MKAVLQRVSEAHVEVDGEVVGRIGEGILLLAGCEAGDTDVDFAWVAKKVATLRIFPAGDSDGHFERSVVDVGGKILAVSQFTLLGDVRKGRRPSFSDAMPVEEARAAFERFVGVLRAEGLSVETGRFQAIMNVHSVNHGPVTILVDSRRPS